MESALAAAAADDSPRIKFLCSFGGSFLPRPLDGKLRYVGGDTRIVTVPREFTYEEFLIRLREVFEGTSIIKYQQPDEDLDALVTVVNDDDVMNMMEEYEKIGASGDGYTKLRIFLFSQPPEHDMSSINSHDERENERRYVDALNKLPDSKSPPSTDIPEHYFGPPPSIDGAIYNLHQINIPNSSSVAQRYGEIDASWSPAYFSPGHYPASPSSSSRFRLAAGEFNDMVQDEYARPLRGNQLHQYEYHSSPPTDNCVWLPPGAVVQEKAGFPSSLGHPHNFMDGNTNCDHCQMTFPRNQGAMPDARYLDPRWKHVQPHIDQPSIPNEYMGNFPNSCGECYNVREQYMVNQDIKIDHGIYAKEQNEHNYHFFNDVHGHHNGWDMHDHQVRFEDARTHHSGVVRMNEPYIVDDNIAKFSFGHGNAYDGSSLSSNALSFGDRLNLHQYSEAGNEAFLTPQIVGVGSYANPTFEESTVLYGNQPPVYGDSLYQLPHNLPPIQSLRRKTQVPTQSGTSYEPSNIMTNDGPVPGLVRHTPEGSPRFSYALVDDQIPNEVLGHSTVMPHKALVSEESTAPEFLYHHGARPTLRGPKQDGLVSLAPMPGLCSASNFHVESSYEPAATSLKTSFPVDKELMACNASDFYQSPIVESDMIPKKQTIEKRGTTEAPDTNISETGNESDGGMCKNVQGLEVDLGGLKFTETKESTLKLRHAVNINAHEDGEFSEGSLSFLPELIASVKKVVLEDAEEVVVNGQSNLEVPSPSKKEPSADCLAETPNAECHADIDGDGEQEKHSKIEPTTAEAEALSKGLQTIRNDDLEEIRELGHGTYGSVYHGKWRGSDVAIKRIKASCFAGRPSERERLIADFWKEALILSSLHHPNVVSFYGVVRDGPDGSLATVTEFMVNGSLKQFLQKKDRTIDRRKRLIIAMDASFGMEYLHSKNIVHFDLKCENLLVNMRDPHRPICKIGDLGLSKVKQHTLVSGGIRGTLPWMAPELLSGKSNMVSEKIDVYSFGIVLWELLTGEEPYADMRGASIIGGIVNNTLRPKTPTWCDPEWKSLMESCWSTDPASRPSFSEISQKLRKMAAAMNLK